MQFNFSWDASVSSAPAAFKAAVLAAGQQFATYFADNITVNLNVGWGEAGGAAVTSPVAAGSFVQSPTTYDDFAANLAAVAASGDDQSTVGALNYLSVSGGAAPFNVANAQSKAFGLIAPTATAADGSIGFSAGVTWDFDPSNGISVGAYDFFAAFAHAASHAMGRVNDGANDPLSLFSFTASGTPAAANATNAYLSMDGGVTKLASFLSSGDLSDFSLPGADAFGQLTSSVATPVTALDLRTMDVLGYTLSLDALATVYSLNLIKVDVSNQTVAGTTAGDLIVLFGSNEKVTPGGGSDTVIGSASFVSGQPSVDTVVYSGSAAQYAVSYNNGIVSVTDGVAARDGVDTLTGIQQLKFTDYMMVVDKHTSQDLLVYELYQAAYARVPDTAGFRYWADVADTLNLSATQAADQFIAAPEFTTRYGVNPTNTAYVTAMYANVLQRAPDTAGLNYWVNNLVQGEARDQLLVDFAVSAENVKLIGAHTVGGYWTT